MRVVLAALVMLASVSAAPPAAAQALPNTMKACSVVVPGSWRDVTTVQQAWTITDCAAYGRQLGATQVQLGCIFATPAPGGQRFSWGRNLSVGATPSMANLPRDNCGWVL